MRSRSLPAWWAALALALALPAPVHGRQIGVRAFISPAGPVAVGSGFVLNVEISGSRGLGTQPQAPGLEPYARYLGSGTSTSMQITNGRTSMSLTLQYRYQATREGTVEIPAVEVVVAGQVYRTDPLTLTVAPAGTAGAAPSPSAATEDELFVEAVASRGRVLEGEPLLVEYRLWTRVDVTSYTVTSMPEPQGFWMEDLTPEGNPQIERRERDGREYVTALVRRMALVPAGPGERTLAPLELDAQVRTRRRSNDPFDRLFGRSLFGGIEATTARSNPLTVEVVPLPARPPADFTGVVGSLSATARLDRTSVPADDAVTLTVRVSGQGHVASVPTPALELPPDFEVFPPEVTASTQPTADGLSGSKTFEWVLLPRAPGDRTIPAVEFPYFDPGEGAFRTASTAPLSLRVTGTASGAAASSGRRGAVDELRRDIRFIHLGAMDLRRPAGGLPSAPGFWVIALLPLLAVAGAVGLRRHRDRLEGDVAYARGRRAGRLGRRRLAEARRLAATDDARAFHAEVARSVRGFIADKLDLPEAGLRRADLVRALEGAGVAPGLVQRTADFLDTCDRYRFAPGAGSRAERDEVLDRAGSLMGELGRAIR